MSRLLHMLLVVGAVLSFGCAPMKSPYMRDVAVPRAIEARPDQATVVFVRPSTWMRGGGVIILDAEGHPLGVSTAQTYFVLEVPPGERTFHVISDPPNALGATLEAGRIYFVEVGMATVNVSQLYATASRTKSWAELPNWMAESTQIEPDAAKLPQLESDLKQMMNLDEEMAKSKQALSAYSPDEKAARTLSAGDGVARWPL